MSAIRNEVLLVEIESTYNTDPVPAAADAVAMRSDFSWSHEGLRMLDRDLIRQSLAKPKKIFGGTLKAMAITVELKGSGAAGTAPEFGKLLRACGLDETIVASTSVTYGPVSSAHESCAIYYFEGNGVRHIVTGCRGSVSFSIDINDVPIAIFRMIGHRVSETDQSLPTPVYDSTSPVAPVGSTFTYGGVSKVITGINIDQNNEMALPDSLSASDGYGEVKISGRAYGGAFDAESTLVATDPVLADFYAGVTNAIVLGPIGATAGNIVTINAPAAYYDDVSPSEKSGIRVYDHPYLLDESSGDDELSLAFT